MLQWFQRLMPHQDVFFPAFEGMQPLLLKRRWPCVRWSSKATNSSFASKKFSHSSTKPTALLETFFSAYGRHLLRRSTGTIFRA